MSQPTPPQPTRSLRQQARRLVWLTEAQAALGWGIIIILIALLGAIYLSQTSKIATTGRPVQILQGELTGSKRGNATVDRLTLYLERAPFGGTIEGVDAASWAYLGKPAARLSHAEAALLAVLPQSPSRLRPDRHPDAARVARDKVLQRMADLGVWSKAERRRCPHRARRRTQPAGADECGAAGRTPETPPAACLTHRLDHGRQPAVDAGGARARLLFHAAGAYIRRVAGGRQRHDGSARLRRLGGVRRSRAPGACRHGAGMALAGIDAEAVPVGTGAGRWPDPFREPADRWAMVRLFRESVTHKPADESFLQGWKEALKNEVLPIEQLWEGIDGL